mgnify:CR=1 FL=1
MAYIILFMESGPSMLDTSGKIKTKYQLFSDFSKGLIVTPVAGRRYSKIRKIGNFDFYSYPYYSGNFLLRNLKFFFRVLSAVHDYNKHADIDVVVSPNPLFGGIVALTVRFFTAAKVIVEVNGDFEYSFKFGANANNYLKLTDRFKISIARAMISYVLKRADITKLLYQDQLVPLCLAKDKIRTRAFADYVGIQEFIEADKGDNNYVLLLGYPWYLKGVDILIKAFKKVVCYFPNLKLKIVGWCPEGREYFEKLSYGFSNIELCHPVPYQEVIPLMANCSLYVLASRTEAMGRVLLEAMACQKPIIASDVGGVRSVIRDGFNGLLFEAENVEDLAEKMWRVLTDKSLAERLSLNGYKYVQERFSEECYIEHYKRMIEDVCSK